MIYRRRASPLHAARAGATVAYGLALVVLALSFDQPVILAAIALATCTAAVLAGVGAEVRRAARFTVPLAVLIALVNALVVRDGLTVIARLGDVPPLGRIDVTLEALVYGLLLGLRVVVIVLCSALMTATVDPDAVLRGLRRTSFRSALTAALATRMVPVLSRDAQRLHLAWRCRPEAIDISRPRAQLAIVRAVATGALDRAVDVAATLELRGYATARRAPRSGVRTPWSRHDVTVSIAAAGLALLAVTGLIAGWGRIEAYPRLDLSPGAADASLAVAIVVLTLLPFTSRRGIDP